MKLPAFPNTLLFATIAVSTLSAQQSSEVSITKTDLPDWVDSPILEIPESPPSAEHSDGVWYLLSDNQVNSIEAVSFYRGAKQLTNESGVEDYSTITIEFDPSYQKLQLHTLKIHRGGETIDRLAEQVFEVLTSDTSRESLLYDRNIEAHAILKDIQTRDILEYAYSIHGSNPVLEGRFDWAARLNWNVPLKERHVRLIWPKGIPLHIKHFNTQLTPAISEKPAHTEYKWEADNIAAFLTESDLPSWYNPWALVKLSSFRDWREVAQWGTKLYAIDEPIPQMLKDEIERIRVIPNKASQIMEALRYTQSKIRYTGIASGTHNYKPYSLDLVCQRRFGDCKDKSRVLSTLLNELGFEAYPALVETDYGKILDQMPPAPSVFDHAVVALQFNGQTYWLDGTRTPQYGELEDVYFPDYGYGLILNETTADLTPISPRGYSQSQMNVKDTYQELAGNKATLLVETEYTGNSADWARAYFNSQNRAELQKDYLNFYARYFPDLSVVNEILLEDHPAENRFLLSESYHIDELFTPGDDPDDGKIYAAFYATSVDDNHTEPTTRIRTMPFYQPYPSNASHKVEINFVDDNWDLESDETLIENNTFKFAYSEKYSYKKMTLLYRYESKRDHTPAGETAAYLKDIEALNDLIGYELFKYVIGSNSASADEATSSTNTPLLTLNIFLMSIAFPLAIFYLVKQRKLEPPPEVLDHPLHGIGGWLILPAIGIIFIPISNVVSILTEQNSIDLETWLAITTPGEESYHHLWSVIIYIERALDAVLISLSLITPFLFFRKKKGFPRTYIATLIIGLAGRVVITVLAYNIPNFDQQVYSETIAEIVKIAISTCIWIPYMLVSKRAQKTFVY